MRIRISTVLVTLGFCAAIASPAQAETRGQQAVKSTEPADRVSSTADQAKPPQAPGTQKPAPQTTKPKPAPKRPIGLRVFGGYEATLMSATESFKAHTGSAVLPGFAVGGDIVNLWKGVFLRVGMSKGSADGTRGFVDETDNFISNGVPMTTTVSNVELAVGWRKHTSRYSRTVFYVGAGMSKLSHSQESPDADSGANNSLSGTGFMGLFGLEFGLKKEIPARPLKRQFFAGFEVQARSVTDVLGASGGSLAFGEDNLGGIAVRALFGIRFKG